MNSSKKYGGRLHREPEEIVDALSFAISEDMTDELRLLREHLDHIEQQIDSQMSLLRKMQAQDQDYINLLTNIPGIKEPAARLIFAEVSNDLSSFPNVERFASWAGLCPGNNESAGKQRSGHAAKGNGHLRKILIESAQAVGLMRKGQLRTIFQAFKERRGHRRAVVATAHKLLRLIYCVIKNKQEFVEQPTSALQKVRVQRFMTSLRNVKKLNYEVLTAGVLVDKETGAITPVDP